MTTTADTSDQLLILDSLMVFIDENRMDPEMNLMPHATIATLLLRELYSKGKEFFTEDEITMIEDARSYLIIFSEIQMMKNRNDEENTDDA